MAELLHDLRVHQIQLEMQNATLREAQIALEASRDRYLDLYEFAPIGYLTLSREGVIQQLNLTSATLLGVDRQQLLQRRFDALVVPEDRVCWLQQFMRAVQCDEPLRCELALRCGEIFLPRHVRLDGRRMMMDNQIPVLRLALTDITEQKQIRNALDENNQMLNSAVRIARLGTWKWDTRDNTNVWSEEQFRIFGVPDTIKPSYDVFFNAVHPEDHDKVKEAIEQGFSGRRPYEVECRVIWPNGELRQVSCRGEVHRGEFGQPIGMIGTVLDITERKRAEDHLRLAASVFSSSQEGIVITNADNRIIEVNPAFTAITGYEREEVLGQPPGLLRSDHQDEAFYVRMWQAIRTVGFWQGELWNRHKSGKPYPVMMSISAVIDEAHRLQHYVGIFSDISLRKAHEASLESIAYYDPLTGVPNRRLLVDRLSQALAHAQRSGRLLAVCYFDLDAFKPVNDQLGHDAGDQLLMGITCRLQTLLRAGDTLARLGGDEFALLLSDLEQDTECFDILERILANIRTPIIIKNQSFPVPVAVSASIGVTLYPHDDAEPGILLRHADEAMYQAKEAGKNCCHLWAASAGSPR